MSWLDKLERKVGWIGVPNLLVFIIVGQVVIWSLQMLSDRDLIQHMVFYLPLFLQGEIWRAVSFLLIPPNASFIFIAFAWYIFYMMGSTLESKWGETRFTLYVVIGILATLSTSLIYPNYPVTNEFMGISVFLAFAYLFPDFELALFFVLPVKIKWLGWLSAALLIFQVFTEPLPIKLQAVAGVFNFLLFFGPDMIRWMGSRQRQATVKAKKTAEAVKAEPFHRCAVCGATDVTHPEREFRYRENKAICETCLEAEQKPAEA